MYKAFDDEGNELFLTNINSLCPIRYLQEAKKIAYDYFIEVEKCPANLEDMFTKFLRPIGSEEITHCWCPREGHNNQLDMQVQRMKEQNLDWVGNRVYTLEDNIEELLNKFICMTDPQEEILNKLNLEEVRIGD
ncbi:MAG: hypothetical protein EKK64_03150 [Neisseriaceae bacterium]|nr:MAG: hypothetical protein EKK64_03150 [Neisseriaceae bacterium]